VLIHVGHLAASSAPRFDGLPHFMSEAADGILRLPGEGVRFGIEPKQGWHRAENG